MKRAFAAGFALGFVLKSLALSVWHLTRDNLALALATTADPIALWLATSVANLAGDPRAIAPTTSQGFVFETMLLIVSGVECGLPAVFLSGLIRRGMRVFEA